MFKIKHAISKSSGKDYYALVYVNESGFETFITFDVQVLLKITSIGELGSLAVGDYINL